MRKIWTWKVKFREFIGDGSDLKQKTRTLNIKADSLSEVERILRGQVRGEVFIILSAKRERLEYINGG